MYNTYKADAVSRVVEGPKCSTVSQIQFAMAFIVIQSRINCAQVKINRLQVSVNNTKSKGSGELTSTGYSSVRTCEQVRWNRWVKLECNSSESNGVFSKQGAGRQVGVWGKLLTLTAVSRRLRHRWGTGSAWGQCGSRVSNRLAIGGADKSRGSRQKVCRGQENDQWIFKLIIREKIWKYPRPNNRLLSPRWCLRLRLSKCLFFYVFSPKTIQLWITGKTSNLRSCKKIIIHIFVSSLTD